MHRFQRFSETLQKLKLSAQKLRVISDKPWKIAAGAALGVFFGILPGGITLAIALAAVLRLNKKAAAVAVLSTNTWSTIVLIPVFAYVGGRLYEVNYLDLAAFYQEAREHGIAYLLSIVLVKDIAVPFIVGMILVAVAAALITYVVIYISVRYYKSTFNQTHL